EGLFPIYYNHMERYISEVLFPIYYNHIESMAKPSTSLMLTRFSETGWFG
ncbi:MAG: hypothetical protein ACI86M_004001, partial [Saprospiraceae bacterium]